MGLAQLEQSLKHLAQVNTIEQLFLTGNPCTDWNKFREFTVATVTQLKQLDGKDISHTERLQALQKLPELTLELREMLQGGTAPERETTYTKESKVEMAKENERIQTEKEESRKKQDDEYYGVKAPKPAELYNANGEIRQCNQGGYKFDLYEENKKNTQFIVLDLFVPRYMDTSVIDVDLNPCYVRINIKEKITQLKFPCEILVEESKVQRAATTGALHLVMPKVVNTLMPFYRLKGEETEVVLKKDDLKETQQEQDTQVTVETSLRGHEEWIDDDEVPPLEEVE